MPVDSPLIPTNTTPAAVAAATTTTTVAPISFTLTTAAATTSAAAIARPLANQAPSRPISSIPQTHHLHYPPQALYTAQHIPVRTPNTQLPKLQQDASQAILYPVASSGRGFVPRPIRPLPVDQSVTVANPGGYPHRPVVSFPHRPIGSPHLDSMSHPMHMARPPNLQQQLIPFSGSSISVSIKGAPNSSDPKVFPPSTIGEANGCKEMRVRDDALCVVRDRKPQYGSFLRSLPRPLPIAVTGADEESIEDLSTQELLKRHVRRAKKVRSRLREERLQRIERYKTRLALLLPPPVEQLRTDNITGS
ncbi:hypothetical protein SDJN02_19971 [Cucurbita argyrosperma subsp. argyrosperma]|nr:hypothetical protein SDJN02_19971 [Cucurbita argyrosperma subsp. argyrosperma]